MRFRPAYNLAEYDIPLYYLRFDRKERMRELEKKTQLLAKKSDSEIKRIGMTDAARDLAAEKVTFQSLLLYFFCISSSQRKHSS